MGHMGARLTGLTGLTEGTGLSGAILAGGRATRLGGVAKGLLDVGGRRMIDRVASALAPVVDSIVLVANAPDAASWLPTARVVADVLEGGGSAAGVHAALRATGQPTIVVAWDLPFVTAALLRALAAAAGPECDAVVPAGRRPGEFEPLCAWYGPRCATAIEAEWETGDRSLHGLLRRVSTIVVPSDAVAAIGSAERLFFNVNSEVDLVEARRLAADDAAPPLA